MLFSKAFSVAVACLCALSSRASPVPGSHNQPVEGAPLVAALTPEEHGAFTHFHNVVTEALASLSAKERELIQVRVSHVISKVSPTAVTPVQHSKRINALVTWEWLIETLGKDLLGAAVKDGHVVLNGPTVAGTAGGAIGSGIMGSFGGYGIAFALGALVTSILSGNLSIGPQPSPTIAVAAPAATAVQIAKPTVNGRHLD